MRKKELLFLSLLFVLIAADTVHAQMFSVTDERTPVNTFSPYVRIGLMPVNFVYTGDVNAIQPRSSLDFKGSVTNIGFESGGFGYSMSLGNKYLGLENRRYFDLSVHIENPFYFISTQNFNLGVPVRAQVRRSSVNSDTLANDFAQYSIKAGAGITSRILFNDKVVTLVQFLPSYGFSSATGGLVGGNVFALSGKARINFLDLLFGRNISLGYDYIYNSYDIEGNEFDYDFTGHLITLGVSL